MSSASSHWDSIYAKRLIIEHPEYSNETIAESCGFSRSHLQVKFKESTGRTNNDWREAQR